MSGSVKQSEPVEHKMPGWLGAMVVIVAIAGGGWFAWSRFAGSGPRVGQKIELAPEPQVRRDARNLGQDVQRALRNLGRNRAAPASRPATAPARR